MLSVVIPVFNEEESLEAFFTELKKFVPEVDSRHEYIFIDDGSTDRSLEILKDFEKENSSVRVFSFRRNLGKAEALTLGFQKAKGHRIVTLDADLQDQPSEIVKLVEQSRDGYDLVCGWRKDRKDTSKMRIISKVFNIILNRMFHLSIHDYNCGLKLFTQEAAKDLRLYGGMHRFIPVLVHEQGFSVSEIATKHVPRRFGESKYKFSKIKDLPDIFTILFLSKYTKKPLHFFGTIGGVVFLVGAVLLTYLSIIHFSGKSIGTRPLLFFGGMMMLGGLQIFFTGFLAELIIELSQKKEPIFNLKYQSD